VTMITYFEHEQRSLFKLLAKEIEQRREPKSWAVQ